MAVLGGLSCAVAAAGMLLPVQAVVNPAHTIGVLANESTITADGFIPGETVRVQLKRNGVIVGSSTGPSDGGTYELNHDFCWDGFTPVMRAGDVLEVRSRTGLDRVSIPGIELTQGPTLLGTDSFTIKGSITPRVPVGELVVEARTEDPVRFRPLAPDTVDGVTGTIAYDDTTSGDFTATFTGMDADQQEAFTNLGGAMVSHAPAANEMVSATLLAGGPGPNCSITAPVVDTAVTAVTPKVLSRSNPTTPLNVQGFATDATGVTVRLRDTDAATTNPTATATLSAATGAQTWRATFTPAQLRGLQGRLVVSAVPAGGTASAVSQTVLRDDRAPAAPTSSHRAGTYRHPQAVTLNAGPGEAVRWTFGDGTQPAPTATRGRLYTGQIAIDRGGVLKAVAVDEAGNVSPVRRQRFRIGTVPTRPRLRGAVAGRPGGRVSAGVRWATPARTGGTKVTGYRVAALRLRDNGSVAGRRLSTRLRPSERTHQMRLRPGRYAFQVRAVNANGNSAWSPRSQAVRAR